MDAFRVQIQNFEGPLDLLLNLIEQRRLHISDVSLSEVTDDFLAHVEQLKEFPTEEIAHFVFIASTLVLIKARSLLPLLPLSEEEEQNIEDLEKRLKLYERVKTLSAHVRSRYADRAMYISQKIDKTPEPVFAPTKEVTLAAIAAVVKNILKYLPRKDAIPQIVVQKIVSIEHMMDDLAARIKGALSMRWSDYTRDKNDVADRVEIAIKFLALLELIKRGVITARQNKHFDDITMDTAAPSLPSYI